MIYRSQPIEIAAL